MAALPEERCHTVKNMADPLFLLNPANQHAPSGEVVCNGLVLSLLEKERSGDECDVIKPCTSYGFGCLREMIV